MKKSILIPVRCATALILVAFCFTILPATLMCCAYIPDAFRENVLEIAPLKLFGSFASVLIFPLGIVALVSALMPPLLIRICCAIGIVCCALIFAHFLLPHSWRVTSFPDPFYNTMWEKAKKEAQEGRNDENIVYDANNSKQILFYEKGFGISEGEFVLTLFSAIPSAALWGELLLRRKLALQERPQADSIL